MPKERIADYAAKHTGIDASRFSDVFGSAPAHHKAMVTIRREFSRQRCLVNVNRILKFLAGLGMIAGTSIMAWLIAFWRSHVTVELVYGMLFAFAGLHAIMCVMGIASFYKATHVHKGSKDVAMRSRHAVLANLFSMVTYTTWGVFCVVGSHINGIATSSLTAVGEYESFGTIFLLGILASVPVGFFVSLLVQVEMVSHGKFRAAFRGLLNGIAANDNAFSKQVESKRRN